MDKNHLLDKPLWQMTGSEFLSLQKNAESGSDNPVEIKQPGVKYVYGLRGLAELLGCSIPTAFRVKRSGRIDQAITQIGRKIIINSELALELAGRKNGGRR